MAAIKRAQKRVHLDASQKARTFLPRDWLDACGIVDDFDLVLAGNVIVIKAPDQTQESDHDIANVEDESEFASFLHHLANEAFTHPDQLVDVGELIAGDEHLVAGVTLDE